MRRERETTKPALLLILQVNKFYWDKNIDILNLLILGEILININSINFYII